MASKAKVTPATQSKDKSGIEISSPLTKLSLPDFKKLTDTANDMSMSVMEKKKKLTEVLSKNFDNIIAESDNFEYCDGLYKNLSYEAMMKEVEMDYPRI